MKPALRAAGAAAAGAATVAGFAPLALWPLPILTLAWLFRAWCRSDGPWQAARLGYAWGLGFFLVGVSWVYVSLNEFGGMPPPLAAVATFLFCALLAAFPALAGYAFRRLGSGDSGDLWLGAGLWTLSEWLRGWIFTGFPWLALGYAQTPPSPLAGFAPLFGVYGVGALVALCAAALALAASKRHAALMLAALAAGGIVLHGVAWTTPLGAPLSVSLLQGNIPQSLKWDPKRLALSLETYAQLAQRYPADLTVLPETAIPLFFDEVPRQLFADLTRHGAALVGVAVRTTNGGYSNGAVLVTPRHAGDFAVQAYAKRHLVPFGEYAPPGFAWFFNFASIPMSDFTAGAAGQKPLSVAGQRIAANICYEDLFGEEIIDALPDATLLVNLSNTAWFGDSLAQPQHLQIARMRALETGRPMLRATNTGMTAAITPDGTVAAVLAPFSVGALRVAIQGYSGATPFVRYGNTAALLLALLACLPALRRRRLRRQATLQ